MRCDIEIAHIAVWYFLFLSRLNGLPLAFNSKKVQLLSRVGTIISDQAYVHFDVETELVIFKPKIDDIIQVLVTNLLFNMLL